MSQNNQWDSLDYQVLNFPYNRVESEFSPEPRIFRGQNSYVTLGGKLAKRPGTITLDTDNYINGGRIDRLWAYETLESPPNVYIIASVFTGTYWELRTKLMKTPAVSWSTPTNFRDSNLSTRPHTLVVSRGLAYVKGFPTGSSSEKLGTVILDGTGATIAVRPWGLLGPQTPATVLGAVTKLSADCTAAATTITVSSDTNFPAVPFDIQIGYEQIRVTAGLPGLSWTVTRGTNGTTAATHSAGEPVIWLNWSISAHLVEVNFGWKYSYAYKTITGHVSNRAPLQTNPDLLPSFTGPFFDLIPKITVQGHSDTANITKICIYRTTDGGGTFYKLKEITNSGSGPIVYTDDSLASGSSSSTFSDPLPDNVLGTNNLGPSLVSNSPPPTVLAPLVTGTATPADATPMVSFVSRLWYGIGNVLFFSAEEELNEGIPEEAWPSGAQNGRNGNFYRFQYPIVNLIEAKDVLYVFTLQSTFKVTGSNLETLKIDPLFENVGAASGHPRAVNRSGELVAFLTNEYRVCLIDNGNLRLISDPLWTDLIDQVNLGTEIDIKFYNDLDKEWIIVSSYLKTATTDSRQWIYDIKKSAMVQNTFWFPPWTIRATASLSARASNTSSQRRLIFATYSESLNKSGLVRIDPTARTGSDDFLGTATGFTFNVEFHQMRVPAGNHVNQLRVPGTTPTVYGVEIDRILFANDTDPDTYWYYDDLWTDPDQATRIESPQRRIPSKGYKTLLYTIHRTCQHFSARITKITSTELFEIMRFTVIWSPDAGS